MKTKTIMNPRMSWVMLLCTCLLGMALPATAQNQIINNGKLRFGNGAEPSINATGNLQQPFYFNAAQNVFYKLTFSNYPLDNAYGAGGDGTSEWNLSGLIAVNPSMSNRTVNASGFIATSGVTGYGTISTTGQVAVGTQTMEVTNTYVLAQTASFIKVTTRIKNVSALPMPNVRYWIGTRDDWVGNSDVTRKQKGNLSSTSFVPNTVQTARALALRITTGSEGVLFYTASPKANVIVHPNYGDFNSRIVQTSPANSPLDITTDGAYGMYVRLNDLAANATEEFTWYYAAGDVASFDAIINQVATASGAVQNITFNSATLNATSSATGTGFWMVVPAGSTAPTAAQIAAGANYGAVTVRAAGSGAVTANTQAAFAMTSLAPATNYTVYFVARDGSNNFSAVANTSFSTLACPVPTITASGPTTFCQGGSVTLQSSNGLTYTWPGGASTPSITVSNSGSYAVTVNHGEGCITTSAPVVLTVNAIPNVSIAAAGATTLCPGGSVALTAQGATTYSWSTGATTATIAANQTGSYTVTGTTNGCSSTASTSVLVQDTTAPVIVCPAPISVVATSAAGAVVAYALPTATDDCSSSPTINLLSGLPSGSTFPIGTTPVTFEANDGNGNRVQCSFDITVAGVAPQIACPASIVANILPGLCSAPVNFQATETVGIPASTITYSIAPGSNFNTGTTTVIATATNAVGSSQCSFTATVQDNQAPVLAGVPANEEVECSAVPAPATLTASDNCASSVTVNYSQIITPGGLPVNGLKGAWQFNEGSGSSIADASGNGNNGVKTPNVSWTTGYAGSGLHFPGTGNDYVSVANTTGGALDARYSISMFAMVIPGNNGSLEMPIMQYDPSGWGVHLWQTGPNRLFIRFTRRGDNQFTQYLSADVLIPNTWNCVGATYDYNTGVAKLWHNGVAVQTLNIGQLELATNAELRFGSVDFDGRRTNGSIDNAVIYNRALDASEVAMICAASCPQTYKITRIWSATDAAGNTSSASQEITVRDRTAPVLSAAQANTTVECDAVPAAAVLTAQDNCDAAPLVAYSEVRANGNCPSNYTLTRTWTATDACGNSSQATQVITVQDTQAPVLSAAPANAVVDCQSLPAAATLTAVDACDPEAQVSMVETSTQNADVNNTGHYNYTITRTWTATDACGNSSQATQLITVQDITAPAITAPANATVHCQDDASSNANGMATGSDICSPVTITQSNASSQHPDVNNAGHYNYVITRTWRATDVSGNYSEAVQLITVQDVTAPAITAPANALRNCQDDATSETNGEATATDNCSPVTITQSDVSTRDANSNNAGHCNYVITRTWRATDVSGNYSEATQTITVQDITAPVVSCPADVTLNCQDGNSSANTGNATATDHCSPVTITQSDVRTQNADVNNAGHYNYVITRTWRATDVSGNYSACVQTITVRDVTAPVVSLPANATRNCQDDLSSANNGVATATDNCSPVAITQSDVSTKHPDANNAGHYNYVISRTWRATDVSGNFSEAVQLITVRDVTAPVVVCPANRTLNCQDGNSSANTGVASGSDNCSPVAISQSQTSTQSADVNSAAHYNYVITRTWTATDVSGNSSSSVQTITVRDVTAPTAVCRPVTITLVNGQASITTAMVNGGSTDNCSPLAYSLSKTSFSCANLGANVVTLTVTDVSGNRSTCQATVTVVGEIPTCSIASQPTDNTFTGGNANNLYLGYGAQSTVLALTVPASGAPYTFSWTGNGTLSSNTVQSPLFTPTVAGVYTFRVLVTNRFGCTTICTISLCVTDIRVKSANGSWDGKKVYVCHVPPGNPANSNTLEISVNAVKAHIGPGGHATDRLGKCEVAPCTAPMLNRTNGKMPEEAAHAECSIKAWPNPTTGQFQLALEGYHPGKVNIEVLDNYGKTIILQSMMVSSNKEVYQIDLSRFAKGIYRVRVVTAEEGSKTLQVIYQR